MPPKVYCSRRKYKNTCTKDGNCIWDDTLQQCKTHTTGNIGHTQPQPQNASENNNYKKLSNNIKKRLINKAKNARNALQFPYMSKNHEEHCRKGVPLIVPSQLVQNKITVPVFSLNLGKPIRVTNKEFKLDPPHSNYYEKLVSRYFDQSQIDHDWIKDSVKYLKSLTREDLQTLKSYTNTSAVNEILRNPKLIEDGSAIVQLAPPQIRRLLVNTTDLSKYTNDTELQQKIHLYKYSTGYNAFKLHDLVTAQALYHYKLFKPQFWKDVIDMYIADLNRIISNSPTPSKRMYVYRFVKEQFFLKQSRGFVFLNKGYVSTSLSPHGMVQQFFGHYMQRILIKPGSKLLLLLPISRYPKELEVLLPHESIFKITTPQKYVRLLNVSRVKDICGKRLQNVIMTDMELLRPQH